MTQKLKNFRLKCASCNPGGSKMWKSKYEKSNLWRLTWITWSKSMIHDCEILSSNIRDIMQKTSRKSEKLKSESKRHTLALAIWKCNKNCASYPLWYWVGLKSFLCTFHREKTACLHFGRNNPLHTYSMFSKDGGHGELNSSVCKRDLGGLIDDQLCFHSHISSIVSKANFVLGTIKRTYSYLDSHSLVLLYKALVGPLLEYAVVIWCPHLVKHIILSKVCNGVQQNFYAT